MSISSFGSSLKEEAQFCPGNTKNFLSKWKSVTSDPEILDLILGISLEFIDEPPTQCHAPRPFSFNEKEHLAIQEEVQQLIDKRFVSKISSGWKFISNIFVVPKQNDKFRLIIDLSPLNKFIKKEHFKMDNLEVAVSMIP